MKTDVSKAAYDAIRAAIKKWGPGLGRKDRQVLIGMLAEDFDTLFPARDRSTHDHSLELTAEWRDWAAKSPMVSQMPEVHRRISWFIWKHAGIEPYGSKKSWIAAVSELWEASGRDMSVVEAAILKGNKARLSDGITLKGPRSFIAWARDLRSRKTLKEAEQLRLINLDEEASSGDRDSIINV